MSKTAIILLLNKYDLFIKKIRSKRIKDVSEFAEYHGGDCNPSDAITYFLQKFTSKIINNEHGRVNHFVTNLLDTDSMGQLIVQCKGAIERTMTEGDRE